MSVLSAILIGTGVAFMTVSVIGLFLLPDVYARAHGVAKSETFGLVLVFSGLLLRPDVDAPSAVRLILVLVFALLANPTGVHALLRAAFRSGALPQTLTDQAIADAALRDNGPASEQGGGAG
jgi:multicomponent Na+:H+ antiporter subunit G